MGRGRTKVASHDGVMTLEIAAGGHVIFAASLHSSSVAPMPRLPATAVCQSSTCVSVLATATAVTACPSVACVAQRARRRRTKEVFDFEKEQITQIMLRFMDALMRERRRRTLRGMWANREGRGRRGHPTFLLFLPDRSISCKERAENDLPGNGSLGKAPYKESKKCRVGIKMKR